MFTVLCIAHRVCSGPGGWLCRLQAPCGYRSSSSAPPGRPGSRPCGSARPAWPRSQHVSTAQGAAFRASLGTVTGQQWPLNRPALALGGMTPFTEARPRPFPSPPRTHSPQRPARPRAVSLNLRHPRAEPCSTLTAEPAGSFSGGMETRLLPSS